MDEQEQFSQGKRSSNQRIRSGTFPDAVPLDFHIEEEHYYGEAILLKTTEPGAFDLELDVTLNAEHLGTISRGSDMKWTLKNLADQRITEKIGEIITQWYE